MLPSNNANVQKCLCVEETFPCAYANAQICLCEKTLPCDNANAQICLCAKTPCDKANVQRHYHVMILMCKYASSESLCLHASYYYRANILAVQTVQSIH